MHGLKVKNEIISTGRKIAFKLNELENFISSVNNNIE